ncbi:branched-chain amino acid ABC transporter permease [Paraburkholderia sp. GAS334]|uniref:branched-chain amino acid ABC transporter permease n=1 Tax=Paraburkholderia sp. GAS334 TaxID=3035131 RepID=UPI003D19C6EB
MKTYPYLAPTGYAIFLLGLVTAPVLGVYPVFVMKFLCLALYASAFNLLIGYAGLLSFGHAAFLGGSAYVAGYAMKTWGVEPEIALLGGTAFGALLGAIFGLLAIRRQGIYFAMVTLALAQMVFFLALQSKATGGEDGLQGVPRGKIFGMLNLSNDVTLYYVVVVIVVFAFLFISRLLGSPFGQVLGCIRENSARATSLGYDVDRVKLLVYVISAALSGLAGSLKALVLGFATLADVHWSTSGQVILITLLGGMGTLSGPLMGAAIVTFLNDRLEATAEFLKNLTSIAWFGTLGQYTTLISGFIFVICVLAFRRGVMGELISFANRRRRTR